MADKKPAKKTAAKPAKVEASDPAGTGEDEAVVDERIAKFGPSNADLNPAYKDL